jgi:hypothetical protein
MVRLRRHRLQPLLLLGRTDHRIEPLLERRSVGRRGGRGDRRGGNRGKEGDGKLFDYSAPESK